MTEPYPPTATVGPPPPAPLGRTRLSAERRPAAERRPFGEVFREYRPSFLTGEFVAYIVTVLGVLLASLLVQHTDSHDDYFRADLAWILITALTVGYMLSRGLAKSHRGDREEQRPY